MTLVYAVLKFTIGIRAKREEEIAGTDVAYFGLKETSYPDSLQIEIDPAEGMDAPVVKFEDVAKKQVTK